MGVAWVWQYQSAFTFPGSPVVAGDTQSIADRDRRKNQNVCSLWDGADNEGWMVGDWTPIAGSSQARLLIEYTHFDLCSVW